jgi:ribonucleoside-diphosphate reductase alpha chain
MTLGFVKNRTGEIVEFDAKRIQIAIEKAYLATKTPAEKVPALVKVILEDLEHKHIHLADQDFLDVEMIQDVVEKHLMEAGEYHIAKAYIVYRTKQTEARVKEHEEIIEKIQHHTLMVTKTDNSQQPFDREKIYRVYQRIA